MPAPTTPRPTTGGRTNGTPAESSAHSSGLVLSGLSKALGGQTIIDGLDLEVRAGELVCLLGPSGCGKTTTLRMIGGFIQPDEGRITIAGQDCTRMPPERRPTAMMFQNYALWPHMSVFNNIAFGLRLRKLPKSEIRERVEQTLSLVNLTHHLHSAPAQISGGEQQRVALARALVLEPQVLLLDEPLSNLDAKLRVRVREDIREIQQRVGITTVLVTHDQDEALSISDRIAVMRAGVIEQYTDPGEIYREPSTRYVAEFVGTMNFLRGTADSDGIVLTPSGVRVPCTGPLPVTEQVTDIGVRPEDVRVVPRAGNSPAANDTSPSHGRTAPAGVPGTVVRDTPRGHYKEVTVALGETKIRAFVGSEFHATRVQVSFTRALVYHDGALVPPGGVTPASRALQGSEVN